MQFVDVLRLPFREPDEGNANQLYSSCSNDDGNDFHTGRTNLLRSEFLPAEQVTLLFNGLLAKCAWQRHKTSFQHPVPRDEAYYGDPATYTYSRREYKPLAWISELLNAEDSCGRGTKNQLPMFSARLTN